MLESTDVILGVLSFKSKQILPGSTLIFIIYFSSEPGDLVLISFLKLAVKFFDNIVDLFLCPNPLKLFDFYKGNKLIVEITLFLFCDELWKSFVIELFLVLNYSMFVFWSVSDTILWLYADGCWVIVYPSISNSYYALITFFFVLIPLLKLYSFYLLTNFLPSVALDKAFILWAGTTFSDSGNYKPYLLSSIPQWTLMTWVIGRDLKILFSNSFN